MKKITRLWCWLQVMATTKTVKGGGIFFFQFVYFLFNTATILERIHKPTGKSYRVRLQNKFNREIIIANTIGTFSVNPKNDSFTKSIASFEYTHQDWLDTTQHRGIFLDIGANIGFYSILAVTRYGFTHSHAFEPNPNTYERLKRNIELNGLVDKITVHTVGLSDTRTTAKLTAKKVHTGGSTFVQNKTNQKEADFVTTPIDTFDSLRTQYNISYTDISFIKIDVEGYEYKVLCGMQDTLQHIPQGAYLFIEIHPHAPQAQETKDLIISNDFKLLQSSPQKNFLYQKNS